MRDWARKLIVLMLLLELKNNSSYTFHASRGVVLLGGAAPQDPRIHFPCAHSSSTFRTANEYHASASSLAMSVGDRLQRVVVLGGGLAGLAVSFHLLNLTATRVEAAGPRKSPLLISIFDECEVGEGGASGAMAGLLVRQALICVIRLSICSWIFLTAGCVAAPAYSSRQKDMVGG
jgi:hypothetical protein